MIPRGYERVSKRRKCFVCQHTDWCLIAIDGSSVICPRVESDHRMGDAGWLHRANSNQPILRRSVVPPVNDPTPIDFAPMWRAWMQQTTSSILGPFADELGVSREALRAIGCVWAEDRNAWAFPMRDASNAIVGIRLRSTTGDKYAIKGSNGSGLFIPQNVHPDHRLMICEGPTDCAALLDRQLFAIGRPSCNAGARFILDLIKRIRPREVVIIIDRDPDDSMASKFTRSGAESLADQIWIPTKIITPPRQKDAREWISAGASRAAIEAVISAARFHPRRRSA